jgi:hypothetical protein
MNPHYVTISSSFPNSSPWQVIDTIRDPPSLTIAMQSSGGNWQVDVAVDDPAGVYPNPTLNSSVAHQPGQSFPANVTVFPSSAFAGGGLNRRRLCIHDPSAEPRCCATSGRGPGKCS